MPKRIIYTNNMDSYGEGDQMWPNRPDSDELVAAKELVSKILNENVCNLKDFQIEIMRMWIEGATFKEMGDKISASPECARRNYVRILARMKKFFEENRAKLMSEGFFGEYL